MTNEIQLGIGGNGGPRGWGTGGNGGVRRRGRGGNGGHGGGGAGGAGGSTLGILANFDDGVPYAIDNVFVTSAARAGEGGPGGHSMAQIGQSAPQGMFARVRLIQ